MSTFIASEDGFRPSSEDRSARWPKALFRVFTGKRPLLPYVDDIDIDRIHVREPFNVILLCGGPYDSSGETKSLRDALLKALPPPKALKERELIQAEEITKGFEFGRVYDDILVFETDLAQIVGLIILFCESAGSLAELGAFSVIDEIMNRLFVVVNEDYWNEESFIKLGPLRRIIREVGRDAVLVVSDSDIGLSRPKKDKDIDKGKLAEILDDPLAKRLDAIREPTTLDKERSGHIIKLIVGLVQEYGALTEVEIIDILRAFNINKSELQIRGYLLCAVAVDWLKLVSKGSKDYYIVTSSISVYGVDAATLPIKDGSKKEDKMRRRLSIREYWKNNDRNRFAAIQQAGSGGAGV